MYLFLAFLILDSNITNFKIVNLLGLLGCFLGLDLSFIFIICICNLSGAGMSPMTATSLTAARRLKRRKPYRDTVKSVNQARPGSPRRLPGCVSSSNSSSHILPPSAGEVTGPAGSEHPHHIRRAWQSSVVVQHFVSSDKHAGAHWRQLRRS